MPVTVQALPDQSQEPRIESGPPILSAGMQILPSLWCVITGSPI